MEYLEKLRNIRRILFTAFLITIGFVIIMWLFAICGWMQYFMWAMPGWSVVAANFFVMWMIGILDVAAILLFLIPTIALSCEIAREKRKIAEWEAHREQLWEEIEAQWSAESEKSKPTASASKSTRARAKPASKSRGKKMPF